MLTHIRSRFSFANVVSTLALFIALSTGTAYAAAYVITANNQVAPNTISGHKPPAGDQANLVAGSVTAADLSAPDGWHLVAPNPMVGTTPCPQTPATFCGNWSATSWHNAGGAFAPAAYTKDLQGLVHVRGLVSMDWCQTEARNGDGGSIYASIFVLPSAYRPTHELVFTALDSDTNGSYLVRLDVRPDGVVQVYNDMAPVYPDGFSACDQFVSLDSISFRVGA